MGVQLIPTGVYGPLPKGLVGFLLGRSSVTLQGLQVHPGVIDSDYTGEIKIMAQSLRGQIAIHPQQPIAQLVLVPVHLTGKPLSLQPRREKGFGSSNAYWVEKITNDRPQRTLHIHGKAFQGLLDTGADTSVISSIHWPQEWPTKAATVSLAGIGMAHAPLQSASELFWVDPEGFSGWFQPFIVKDLPLNLWGRDILEVMGAMLYSPSTPAEQKAFRQMLSQGFVPGQGLGKNLQGQPMPLSVSGTPSPFKERHGIGYHSDITSLHNPNPPYPSSDMRVQYPPF